MFCGCLIIRPLPAKQGFPRSEERFRVQSCAMKFIKTVLVVFLLFVLSIGLMLPCFAADHFVSGFETRPSPQICLQESESGLTYAGIYGDDISGSVAYLGSDHIQLYSYAERQFASETVRDGLQNAYAIISRVTTLGDLAPALDDEAHWVDASFTSAAFVASDLIDLSISEDMMESLLDHDGHYFLITFHYDLPENGLLPVCIYQDPVEKTWSVMESWRVTSHSPGTVTIKFDHLGLFAFLHLDPGRMDTAGNTDDAGLIWLGVIAILTFFFGAVAALVAVTHRHARTLSLPSEDTDADGNSATDLPDPIVCPRQEQRSDFGLDSNKGDIP